MLWLIGGLISFGIGFMFWSSLVAAKRADEVIERNHWREEHVSRYIMVREQPEEIARTEN